MILFYWANLILALVAIKDNQYHYIFNKIYNVNNTIVVIIIVVIMNTT